MMNIVTKKSTNSAKNWGFLFAHYWVLLFNHLYYDLNNFLNFLVHTFNPIYFVFYYLIFVNENVTYKKLWVGLIHPLLYFIIILATGPFTGFYAYPFLDVSLNGLGEVLKIKIGRAHV